MSQHLKAPLLVRAAQGRRGARRARVHAHQASRRSAREASRGCTGIGGRAHSRQPVAGAAHRGARRLQGRHVTACWSPPTSPRAASTSRRSDTSSISTCPGAPEDYIHRVGRTARAELTGRRSRSSSPEEEGEPARHRAGDRQPAAASDAAGFRLPGAPGGAARGAARPAYRRDSRAQGGGSRARPVERGAAFAAFDSTEAGAVGRQSARRRARPRRQPPAGGRRPWGR